MKQGYCEPYHGCRIFETIRYFLFVLIEVACDKAFIFYQTNWFKMFKNLTKTGLDLLLIIMVVHCDKGG